jgi:hypothetical protein
MSDPLKTIRRLAAENPAKYAAALASHEAQRAGVEPPLPTLRRQVAGFATTAGAVLASGLERADESTAAARLDICRSCDHYRASDGRCGMVSGCGCVVAGKVVWQAAKCPVDKW